MTTLTLVLMGLGVICLGAAAFGVPASRVSLGWMGAFFFGLAFFIGALPS